MRYYCYKFMGIILTVSWGVFPLAANADDFTFFEQKVRPVLAEHCYPCHSAEKQKSGLRLDHGAYVQQGGETGMVIEAGNPTASRLIEAIQYANVDLQMPPDGKLPEDAIAALEKWVRDGAQWPDEPKPAGTRSTARFPGTTGKIIRHGLGHWPERPTRLDGPLPRHVYVKRVYFCELGDVRSL